VTTAMPLLLILCVHTPTQEEGERLLVSLLILVASCLIFSHGSHAQPRLALLADHPPCGRSLMPWQEPGLSDERRYESRRHNHGRQRRILFLPDNLVG
jgi:hypothetical protein